MLERLGVYLCTVVVIVAVLSSMLMVLCPSPNVQAAMLIAGLALFLAGLMGGGKSERT